MRERIRGYLNALAIMWCKLAPFTPDTAPFILSDANPVFRRRFAAGDLVVIMGGFAVDGSGSGNTNLEFSQGGPNTDPTLPFNNAPGPNGVVFGPTTSNGAFGTANQTPIVVSESSPYVAVRKQVATDATPIYCQMWKIGTVPCGPLEIVRMLGRI